MDNEKITVEFEDGAVIEFEAIGTFVVKGVEYIALLDVENDEEYLFKYIPGEEAFEIADIPEKDFDEVAAEYDKIMEQLEAEEE